MVSDMNQFLKQVAKHYYDEGRLEDMLFVFPSRRASVFFRKYLAELVAERGETILAPRMVTIGDFFSEMSGLRSADRITLLLELYDCYKKLSPQAESLDDFVYWGDVILSDFDDVDKYMVDAKMLFANVSDLKSIEDHFEYADEKQKEAIRRLAGHFKKDESGVKQSFLQIWNLLYPLYVSFVKGLKDKDLSYEGMRYRDLAERLSDTSVADVLEDNYPAVKRCVFVGLNALNECEKLVLRRLRDAGRAQFVWDYEGDFIADDLNPCALFRRENLSDFPQAFALESCRDRESLPQVYSVNVPSASGQARLLPKFISEVPENERGTDFAVILADETFLPNVLGSLPELPGGVNITMGYPMKSSEWMSLMRDVLAAQLHLRTQNGVCFFYHKDVSDILSSSIVRSLLSAEEKAISQSVLNQAKYYVPVSDFGSGGLLAAIFRPAVSDASVASSEQTDSLAVYILSLTSKFGTLMRNASVSEDEEGEVSNLGKFSLQSEFAMRYYKAVSRLSDLHLDILPRTWIHLVEQILSAETVPFEGEPLSGLQIMGPLETRTLDFKHIVILGANEGVFPRSSVSASFVPAQIRSAFGLPTYLRQDAVWAYYFYRLLSRAEDVHMLFDSRAAGLQSGEESRFIKQLRYLYPDKCRFHRLVAAAEVSGSEVSLEIPKTQEDIDIINKMEFSASSLSEYLECSAKFYYHHIKGLETPSEVRECLDAGLLGEVCHDTLEAIYSGGERLFSEQDFDKRDRKREAFVPQTITKAYLQGLLKREDDIRAKIVSLAKAKLRTVEIAGRDLVTVEVILRFVMQVLRRDIALMGNRSSFTVLALEQFFRWEDGNGHRFKGYVDRIDSFEDGVVRVVDYKTGGDDPKVLAPGVNVLPMFSKPEMVHGLKAALQFYLYDRFVEGAFDRSDTFAAASDPRFCDAEVHNAMYAMSELFSTDENARGYSQSDSTNDAISEGLQMKFAEMEDISIPFKRLAAGENNDRICSYCDFAMICGKNKK